MRKLQLRLIERAAAAATEAVPTKRLKWPGLSSPIDAATPAASVEPPMDEPPRRRGNPPHKICALIELPLKNAYAAGKTREQLRDLARKLGRAAQLPKPQTWDRPIRRIIDKVTGAAEKRRLEKQKCERALRRKGLQVAR